MKIYTKTGDKGETSLLGGSRVSKTNERIEAYGTVDELNSHLGLLRDQEISEEAKNRLLAIQNELFDMGAYLACEDDPVRHRISMIAEHQIQRLESEIDHMEQQLKPLKNFILPGGHRSISQCHIARCVCRRAERKVIKLSENVSVDFTVIRYLNRLSDYLFVMARKLGDELDVDEIAWKSTQIN